MSRDVLITMIPALATVIVAALTYYLNESAKRRAEWRRKKFGYYRTLLSGLSGIAGDGTDWDEANNMYARAYNTAGLFASQEVITCLVSLQAEVDPLNKHRSQEKERSLLKGLVLAIRKDMGLSKKDDAGSFPSGFIKAR